MISLELSASIPAILGPLLGTTMLTIHGAKIKNVVTERLGNWGARAKRHGDPVKDTAFIETPTGAKVRVDLHNDHGNTSIIIRDYKHGKNGNPPFATAQEAGLAPFVIDRHTPRTIDLKIAGVTATATYLGSDLEYHRDHRRNLPWRRVEKNRPY